MMDEKLINECAERVKDSFGVLSVNGRNLLVRNGVMGAAPLVESHYSLIVLDQFDATTFAVGSLYANHGDSVLVIPTSTDSDVLHDYTLEEILGVVALVGCDVYAPKVLQDEVSLGELCGASDDDYLHSELVFSEVLNSICLGLGKTLFPFCGHHARRLETCRSFGKNTLKEHCSGNIKYAPYTTCNTSAYDGSAIETSLGDKVVVKDIYGQMQYIGSPNGYKGSGFKYLMIEKFIEGCEGSVSFTVGINGETGFIEPLVHIRETNRLQEGTQFPGPKFGDTVTVQESCADLDVSAFTELAKNMLFSLGVGYYGVFDISFIYDGEDYYVTEFSTRFSNSNMGSILHMLGDKKAYLDLFRNRVTETPASDTLVCAHKYSVGISMMCFNKAAWHDTATKVELPDAVDVYDGSMLSHRLRVDPICIVFDTCFYDYLALDGRAAVCTVIPLPVGDEGVTLRDVIHKGKSAYHSIGDLNVFDTPVLGNVYQFLDSLDTNLMRNTFQPLPKKCK